MSRATSLCITLEIQIWFEHASFRDIFSEWSGALVVFSFLELVFLSVFFWFTPDLESGTRVLKGRSRAQNSSGSPWLSNVAWVNGLTNKGTPRLNRKPWIFPWRSMKYRIFRWFFPQKPMNWLGYSPLLDISNPSLWKSACCQLNSAPTDAGGETLPNVSLETVTIFSPYQLW